MTHLIKSPLLRRIRSQLLSWVDSNDFAWMPPWSVGGTPREREVQELRRKARWLIRQDLARKQGWPRIITQSLVWPVIATIKTALDLNLRRVRFLSKDWFHEFGRIWWFQIFYNLRIADQSEYALHVPGREQLVRSFLSCREQQILLERAGELNSGYPLLNKKDRFARFCEEYNLPHPHTLSEGKGPRIHHHTTWPSEDLILKPTNRWQGKGVEIFTFSPTSGRHLAADGSVITLDSLAAYANRRLQGGPWVLQARLINPPQWRSFTPGPLSTVRVVTGVTSPGGAPVVIGMHVHFAVYSPFVDNTDSGGMTVSIDAKTGRMGIGFTWNPTLIAHTHHPVTGFRIEGAILPDCDELCALALRAHKAAGAWCTIGWDTASTTQGPRLIEANLIWGAMTHTPQGHMQFIEMMKNVLGAHYEKLRFH